MKDQDPKKDEDAQCPGKPEGKEGLFAWLKKAGISIKVTPLTLKPGEQVVINAATGQVSVVPADADGDPLFFCSGACEASSQATLDAVARIDSEIRSDAASILHLALEKNVLSSCGKIKFQNAKEGSIELF